jgi:hypothetical protein
VSIITCLTGWLPEPLPLRFGHISELWKFFSDILPKYQWPEEKQSKLQINDEDTNLANLNNQVLQ